MTFEAFYELYKKNMRDRIKLSTWKMKESVIESKIIPYFKKKRMCDIKPRDVVTWQNTILLLCLRWIWDKISQIELHSEDICPRAML